MPAERSLSPRVHQLLAVIDSFEKLQAMSMIVAQPDQPWSILRIAGELQIDLDDVAPIVHDLVTAGFLQRLPGEQVRYAPPSPDIDAAIHELITAYRDDTLLVVRAITERAMHKIRDVASTFADAFVVRRPKPRGSSDG